MISTGFYFHLGVRAVKRGSPGVQSALILQLNASGRGFHGVAEMRI